jgi:hypothetical protein
MGNEQGISDVFDSIVDHPLLMFAKEMMPYIDEVRSSQYLYLILPCCSSIGIRTR